MKNRLQIIKEKSKASEVKKSVSKNHGSYYARCSRRNNHLWQGFPETQTTVIYGQF
jgi:hypothetical protein